MRRVLLNKGISELQAKKFYMSLWEKIVDARTRKRQETKVPTPSLLFLSLFSLFFSLFYPFTSSLSSNTRNRKSTKRDNKRGRRSTMIPIENS